jgi:hypothetical protein
MFRSDLGDKNNEGRSALGKSSRERTARSCSQEGLADDLQELATMHDIRNDGYRLNGCQNHAQQL